MFILSAGAMAAISKDEKESAPAACACPPAAEEVKKRHDSFLHGDVDKAIDHYTEPVPT